MIHKNLCLSLSAVSLCIYLSPNDFDFRTDILLIPQPLFEELIYIWNSRNGEGGKGNRMCLEDLCCNHRCPPLDTHWRQEDHALKLVHRKRARLGSSKLRIGYVLQLSLVKVQLEKYCLQDPLQSWHNRSFIITTFLFQGTNFQCCLILLFTRH